MTIRLLGIFCLSLAAVACSYNHSKGPSAPMGSPEKALGAAVDYATAANIVSGRCVACHSSQRAEGGVNLESYPLLRAKISRVVARAIEKRDMPPSGPLSEAETKIINSWVNAGAPERASDVAAKPDPTLEQGLDNWQKIKTKIFAAKCLDCHSGAGADAGLDLADLTAVRANAAKIFDRTIVKADMPRSPYPVLIPGERRVLLHWFEQGMIE